LRARWGYIGTDCQSDCVAYLNCRWRLGNTDLDFDRRYCMYCNGRLDRRTGRERHGVNAGTRSND